MACLLQQFKCPSELYIRLHSPQSSTSLKSRQPVCFQMQCVLPMASTMTKATATIEMEKLQLPSFDSHIDSVAIERTLFHKEAIGPFLKENLESTFAKETKFIDGEAAVAAADAIALAKEAAQVAKEVALMFGNKPLDESDSKKLDLPFNVHINRPGGANFSNMDAVDTLTVHYLGIQTEVEEKHSMEVPTKGSDTLDPLDDDELKLLQVQLSSSVAVRSERQKERRARRKRAGEKVSSTTISASTGASSRKKRTSTQNVDYNDPLRHLRGTTSTSKLLTATEELELSNGIQDLLKLETLHEELAEKCGCEPTLAQWAAAAGVDRKTLRKRLNCGTLCKDKMINSNIRLVISIAKNYQGAGMNLQDLVQEGCRGLVRGAEKFDASKGFKFSTYAHWWIKQAVRKSLSDQSRIIRLPFHMVDATYKVKEARKQLFNENGRHPNDKEVAEATGLTMKRLNAVMLAPKAPRSLDQKIGIDQSLKPSDIISDPDAETTEDVLRKRFMKQDLEKVLISLSSRETQVVRWRFGMEDGRMKTLQEIGELMGVSRERVRQIESNAFRKLKNKKRIKNLHQYQFSQA